MAANRWVTLNQLTHDARQDVSLAESLTPRIDHDRMVR